MADQTAERHLSLRPLRLNGERECYVTIFYDQENKVDIVIGGPTPYAALEAFERFSGLQGDIDKVTPALFRKSSPTEIKRGEGFAYFRKRALKALYG